MAILVGACIIIVLCVVASLTLFSSHTTYKVEVVEIATTSPADLSRAVATSSIVVYHLATPDPLKAVYMTSWAAGNKKFRSELDNLVTSTEINAVIIDIKDYTGRISFPVDDPALQAIGSAEKRIPDIKEYIKGLHDKGVYVIGRISSFQDTFLVNLHPEWAVKTKEGGVWADYKGVKWLDAGAQPVWDYLVSIGNEAYADGFDELNFDYIRYPSDGNMKDISYVWSDGRNREEVMRSFFLYLREKFASTSIPLSADFFGLTTSSEDDLGIGQSLLDALPYFDYVAPMVYPSHFAHGFLGYTKPAEHPYEVVKYSMDKAIAKAEATTTRDKSQGLEPIASTSPQLYTKTVYDKNKLRPWLQSFDLGAKYTPAMIREQIKATNDSGLTSWMLWDAASVYDPKALLLK